MEKVICSKNMMPLKLEIKEVVENMKFSLVSDGLMVWLFGFYKSSGISYYYLIVDNIYLYLMSEIYKHENQMIIRFPKDVAAKIR